MHHETTTENPFKRGTRWQHHKMICADAERTPMTVQVTSTKRYTRRTGEDSTLIYFRLVLRYCTGREELGAKYYCDIEDARNWKASP